MLHFSKFSVVIIVERLIKLSHSNQWLKFNESWMKTQFYCISIDAIRYKNTDLWFAMLINQ